MAKQKKSRQTNIVQRDNGKVVFFVLSNNQSTSVVSFSSIALSEILTAYPIRDFVAQK